MKLLKSYKKIAKEFIKEAAWDRKFGEPLPTLSSVMKKTKNEGAYDDDADKQGRDDGESWMANSSAGDYGAKHKGKIRYFDDEDSAKAYAKSGSEDGQGADDSGDEPKGKALGGSDFERDFKKIPISDPDDEDSEVGKYLKSKGDKDDSDDGDIDRSKSYDGRVKGDSEIDSQFPDSELAEEPFEHDDYDEEMEMEIADEITSYFVDNIDKVAKKDYTPEEMQDLVNAESEKLVAMYQKPNGVPNEKRNMLAYRNYLINHVKNTIGVKDREAGDDNESIKVINGKKYKPIKESKEPTKPTIHLFKETYKKIGGK